MIKWALLAPALILCAVFVLWPLGEVVNLALVKTNFITTEFVGLRNYIRAFSDVVFLRAVLNSVFYILIFVPLSQIPGIFLTLIIMDMRPRWQNATRFALYIPSLTAGMIVAQIWNWIWHIEGPINWAIRSNVWWFGSSTTAIPAISITTVSAVLGAGVILLLAAASMINKELFDAAKIDGASPWQIKLRIVLPLIAPMIAIKTLIAVIAAPQILEFVIALAPYEHSATLAFHIYMNAFIMSRHGPAAAKAVMLLVWMVTMAVLKNRIMRER